LSDVTAKFSNLPQNLYRSNQVREFDRIAIEEYGISGQTLMERAGMAVFSVIQANWPKQRHLTVLCGGGNNGGDGYVIARLAMEAGYAVNVICMVEPDKLQGDAKTAADLLQKAGLVPQPYTATVLEKSELIVDALLGTGLDRDVTGNLFNVIEEINKVYLPVISVDIPSGLNADTGQVMGTCIKACATISFIGLKQGLFTNQGPDFTGRIYFNDLNVSPDIYTKEPCAAVRINLDTQQSFLQPRSRTAHKGHFGHALIVGGDFGYPGAPLMAAEAAARVGAGLVSVATHARFAASMANRRPEIMAHGIENPSDLIPLLDKANVIAIGPGLGQSEWSKMMFSRILETSLPLIVDADALNFLAADPIRQNSWILTPHPGEAARLLGTSTMDIQADRFAAIHALQDKFGGFIVLKGSGTLILDPDNNVYLCNDGNPGMASGGMGDVLTGVLTGLVAQGLHLYQAATLGVCLHARAGDKAVAEEGERGLLASDLMPWLRRLVNPVY
jgi:ADP-dependent NAD(P)H-hydrate dehydratase / NAD(P)H-hydrate epimerase